MSETTKRDNKTTDKSNTLLAERMRELITDTKELKEYLGCSAQAINQFKQGTAYPKTENLIKIASFYNVSVDYLLGLSNAKSMDTTVQTICKYTGLSEKSVNSLHLWANTSGYQAEWGKYISAILDSSRSSDLLVVLSEIAGDSSLERAADKYGNTKLKKDISDRQRAQQWYVSQIFESIMDDICFELRTKGSVTNG